MKRVEGRAETEKMLNEFPYLVVHWRKGNVRKHEYCDLRRAAAILNTRIENVYENMRWGEGNWETENFVIRRVEVSKWIAEVAKQRS
jgi:hypothetical protein